MAEIIECDRCFYQIRLDEEAQYYHSRDNTQHLCRECFEDERRQAPLPGCRGAEPQHRNPGNVR